MDKCIYDENNGLWYELVVDYYSPCWHCHPKKISQSEYGGQRHLQYIRNCKRILYTSLLTSCKLNS